MQRRSAGDRSGAAERRAIGWRGWGYRHIVAKHGWGALDRSDTETALLAPAFKLARGDKTTYCGPQWATQSGIVCHREVVVDRGMDSREVELGTGPRQIVTSYSAVGPAPTS